MQRGIPYFEEILGNDNFGINVMFKLAMPTIKLSTAISMAISVMLAYYLLLCDNCFHCSISSVISYANGLNIKQHLIMMGLLPIYIAVMIFGSVLVGLYLGSLVDTKFARAERE